MHFSKCIDFRSRKVEKATDLNRKERESVHKRERERKVDKVVCKSANEKKRESHRNLLIEGSTLEHVCVCQ